MSKFITLEGCEGVGKSTQIKLLQQYCSDHKIDAIFTREPGGTDISEKIRHIILDPENIKMDSMTELLLYTASRRQHVKEFIEPSLKSGKIVFCDRFIDSTLSYQGYARGLDINTIIYLNNIAMGELKIDLTLFLDIDSQTGFKRKGGIDANDRLEKEGFAFHEKVYKGFKEISKANTTRFCEVDASGNIITTHTKIINILKNKNIF